MQKDFQKKKFAIYKQRRNIVIFSKKKINPKLRALILYLLTDLSFVVVDKKLMLNFIKHNPSFLESVFDMLRLIMKEIGCRNFL